MIGIILSILLIVLLIYALLWLPPIQQKIKNLALREVMKMTESKISIGELRFRPFNSIHLSEIYVADQKKDTLLYVHSLTADFDLLHLLNNRLSIHSVDLDGLYLNVSKETPDSAFNFQFLIDAFTSSDTVKKSEPSALTVKIEKFSLKAGRINYNVLSEPFLETESIDINHVAIENLNMEAELSSINIEDLDVALKRFSLEEKKGFVLSDLKMDIQSDHSIIRLSDLNLKLPRSEIKGNALLDYSGMELSELLSGAKYDLAIASDHFLPEDIRFFYPAIETFTDALNLNIELKGQFPQIQIPILEINYGSDLMVKADAELADMNAWETASFSLHLAHLYVSNSFVSQVLSLTSEPVLMSLPSHLKMLKAHANVSGSLPDFNAYLEARTDQGVCVLNARAGVSGDNSVHFDSDLNIADFDLGGMVLDTIFGKADFAVKSQGYISENGVINVSASAVVNRFDYNSYSYKDIKASGFYRGDSIRAEIVSRDQNLPVELIAHANLEKRNPSADLYLKLSNIHLDSLNLLPNHPESEISMIVKADVKGFDPEEMNARLSIDSLYVQTQTGTFDDHGISALYSARSDSRKELNIQSKVLNVMSRGQFTFSGVDKALKDAFPVLFPSLPSRKKMKEATNPNEENFNLVLQIRRSNAILPLLGIQSEIPDSALVVVRYKNADSQLGVNSSAFCIYNETDMLRLNVDLSNIGNNLDIMLQVDNKSQQYDLNAKLNAEVEFIPIADATIPDMNVNIKPTVVKFNESVFNIRPAHLSISDKRYEVNNFALEYSDTEYLKIDGVASDKPGDSLILKINDFHISTLLEAMRLNFPLSGIASGEIQASQVLSTPFVLTRNFAIDSIRFDNNPIGNLTLMSGWNPNRKGLGFQLGLIGEDTPESLISGFYIPARDSLFLTGSVRGLKLDWFQGFMQETLFGLNGSVGANFNAFGSLSNPKLNGNIYFDQAQVGVKMLNAKYTFSDSIRILPNSFDFRRFTIRDEENKTAVINGQITHSQFANINPNLRISLDNFMVMNNEQHTDSLFFGNMQLSGSLTILSRNNSWMLGGNLSHGRNNTIMINMPSSSTEAQRYGNITFVDSDGKTMEDPNEMKIGVDVPTVSLPLKIDNLSINLNPELNMGVVYNPATGDRIRVSGTGNLILAMDTKTANTSLLGNYVLDSGDLTVSLTNITRKSFAVQEGSELIFRGDPLRTGFDITAIYSLRADLLSLDPSFGDMGLANTKVNVQCHLTINGDLNNMKLSYNVVLPNQPDDVQKKMESIFYTDDIKIKQIAYLLALGSFMPPGSHIGTGNSGNIWTSLASSSITNQLNNLLTGVLSENWSIGTDLQTSDANFSQVEMDVNVSTRLFNNRLTINTTLGYNNDINQRENFTGDFDFEYKLTPSGNILLRFYNITNNQYYEKARMTQGVGVLYNRQGKTFKQLFRSFSTKRNQPLFNRSRDRVRSGSQEAPNVKEEENKN